MQRQSEKVIQKCKEKKLFSLFFFVFFIPACGILLTVANFESKDIDDVRTFLTFHSRWGMPLWGFIIPAGASVSYAFMVFYIKNFPLIFN